MNNNNLLDYLKNGFNLAENMGLPNIETSNQKRRSNNYSSFNPTGIIEKFLNRLNEIKDEVGQNAEIDIDKNRFSVVIKYRSKQYPRCHWGFVDCPRGDYMSETLYNHLDDRRKFDFCVKTEYTSDDPKLVYKKYFPIESMSSSDPIKIYDKIIFFLRTFQRIDYDTTKDYFLDLVTFMGDISSFSQEKLDRIKVSFYSQYFKKKETLKKASAVFRNQGLGKRPINSVYIELKKLIQFNEDRSISLRGIIQDLNEIKKRNPTLFHESSFKNDTINQLLEDHLNTPLPNELLEKKGEMDEKDRISNSEESDEDDIKDKRKRKKHQKEQKDKYNKHKSNKKQKL